MVSRICKSAERLKHLVDDVLLIVRAETNQIKLDLQKVAFTYFDDSAPELQKGLKQKQQNIVTRLDSQAVNADVRLVKQVLYRLVHNAIKFGAESTDIHIESIKSGDNLRFIVHNKGPQLPTSVIDKITKPFYIDEDIMHHSTGTGLGLTICHAILKSHNSGLQFKNTSHGVMVYFELPLA